jgi:hypothetical protein
VIGRALRRQSYYLNEQGLFKVEYADVFGVPCPSTTLNSGIIGETADMDLKHLGDMRPSSLVFHVTQRLLYTKWRDPGEEPKLYLLWTTQAHHQTMDRRPPS